VLDAVTQNGLIFVLLKSDAGEIHALRPTESPVQRTTGEENCFVSRCHKISS